MGYENSGRRPKPTALKILQGNPGKRKPNKNEVRPPAGEIVKPSGLSAGAGVVWDELAPVCVAMGTLTLADLKPFAGLCELQATFTGNALKKDTEGFRSTLELTTANALRPYYEYFGLTPVSRARISVPKTKPDEPASKWAGALK